MPTVVSHAVFLTWNDGTDNPKTFLMEYVSVNPQLSIKTHLMGTIPASKCGFNLVCMSGNF